MESLERTGDMHPATRERRGWLGGILLGVFLVLASAQAVAGDKVNREGTLVQGPVRAEDTWVGEGTVTGIKAKNWIFIFKVGEYTYAAYADRIGGIFAAKGPDKKDWPDNATLKLTFFTRMGSLYVDIESPTGKKEESMWVFSKKDKDGKELCGSFKCAKSPEDSKDG